MKGLPLTLEDQNIHRYREAFRGLPGVLAGGCFDVLHPGHKEFLRRARAYGEKLILLLESDERIRALKGKQRPINPQETRASHLLATGLVDCIVLLSSDIQNDDYTKLIETIAPQVIAITEGDPITKRKQDQAAFVGARVVEVMKRDTRYSTSQAIQNQGT